jgi:hypothetical protein
VPRCKRATVACAGLRRQGRGHPPKSRAVVRSKSQHTFKIMLALPTTHDFSSWPVRITVTAAAVAQLAPRTLCVPSSRLSQFSCRQGSALRWRAHRLPCAHARYRGGAAPRPSTTTSTHGFNFRHDHKFIDLRSRATRSPLIELDRLAEAALLQSSSATDARHFKGSLMFKLLSPCLTHVEFILIAYHTGMFSPLGRGVGCAERLVHVVHVVSQLLPAMQQ